ncbi:MAG: hybrid sensor histidine kinase/response regulator [Bacteroidales bacterium]|jgi:signal transduction histidine kinase/CheY-like chemotaxis protein/PAS domain-containing protein|nr:hybrid sensor histidine kinase/response regulator [Bacteroidales bacterium]
MKKILKKIIPFIIAVCLVFPSVRLLAENHGQIFIISSYSYNNLWGEEICKNIRESIRKNLSREKIRTFYTGINDKDVFSSDLFRMDSDRRIKDNTPDVMIFIGERAWTEFIKTFPDKITSIPSIIVDGNDSLKIDPKYNATAIILAGQIRNTLALADNAYPEKGNFIFISTGSHSDNLAITKIRTYIKERYPNKRFSYLVKRNFNPESLQKETSNTNKKKNDIILVNDLYNSHGIRNGYSDNGKHTVPVFSIKDQIKSCGNIISGASITPNAIIAEAVASLTKSALSGKKLSSVPPQKFSATVNIVNRSVAGNSELKKRGIPYVTIPKCFYESDGTRNIAILASILLLAFIIFSIIYSFIIKKRQKAATGDLNYYMSLSKEYNTILHTFPFGFLIFDIDGNYIRGNASGENLLKSHVPSFGKARKDFNLFRSILMTDNISTLLQKGKKAYCQIKFKGENPICLCRFIYSPFRDNGREFFLLIAHDISKNYAKREKKEEIESMTIKALNTANIGIGEFNIMNNTGIATDAWYSNLKTEPNTNFRKCFDYLIGEDKKAIDTFMENALEGKSKKFAMEARVSNIDYSYRWIRISATINTYYPKEGRIICSMIIEDIDIQKKKNDEIEEEYKKIMNASIANNSLISNMSHEIKTPLNSIVGFSELLTESNDDNEKKALFSYIEENNERLLDIISNLIEISKIESGNMVCSMSEVDINQMILVLKDIYSHKLEGKDVQIIYDNEEGQCIIYSDGERINTIISNFMDNAVKFTEKGTVTVGYKIETGKIALYVKDTGVGVPYAVKETLFKKFNNPNNNYLGLGLQLSASIVKLLKGEIGYDPNPEGGSIFWIRIPSEYINNSPEKDTNASLEIASARNPRPLENMKKIIIAEDNDNNFQLLNYMLKGRYSIYHAENGAEALDLYKNVKPDAILMDIKMPVMDGYQATAEIRKLSSDIPIIAVTAYAFEKDREKIMNSNFSDFISKPVMEKELIKKLDSFLKD